MNEASTVTVLKDKFIVLGVTGSIACYKAIDLASKLTQAGALVDVILTEAAQQFIRPLAFQAVTGRAVYSDLWTTESGNSGLPSHIAHIGLAERADLLLIAPATVQHIAKFAHGFADDLLSITALAARCPMLVAPAGDGQMLEHGAVVANLRTLAERGVTIIPPETGRMASGLSGVGRLPETPTLLGAVRRTLGKIKGSLIGRKVIVTAGGTREALDPVRFISNHSSGKQGYALVQAAVDAGAEVTLISTPTGLAIPFGAEYIPVESAAQMLEAVLSHTTAADVLVMAAAVADYRPATISAQKIKKTASDLTLALGRTEDILRAVGERKRQTNFPRILVGFAAETQDLLANAQNKLVQKNADIIVANDVTMPGAGFGTETNVVTLLRRDDVPVVLPQQSKSAIAEAIIAQVAARLE